MRIHLIAIGGAVMHNMALALAEAGHQVTGSDDEIFEPSRSRLAKYGLLPEAMGWFPEKIDHTLDAVILGMHARADNPELLAAQKLGISVYNFPEYVYEHSKEAIRIAICGSHGKTTITSMIMHVLQNMQRHFDYLVGAQLAGFETMVKFSNAPVMVIEGDEYFASPIDRRPKFLFYRPQIALISGIAWDHFNVFPKFSDYTDQFKLFLEKLTTDSLLIVNGEDAVIRDLLQESKCVSRIIQYYALQYAGIANGTSVEHGGKKYTWKIFGRHNMENAAGAMEVCKALGISGDDFCLAMQSFTGASRRLECIHQDNDLIILRDFAHAPSKVQATVAAVREQYPDKNMTACLELHTFSSLNVDFLGQYRNCMHVADQRIVYFNPHTVEMKKLPPLTTDEVRRLFNDTGLEVFDDVQKLLRHLQALHGTHGVLLLMSSGSFDNMDMRILT